MQQDDYTKDEELEEDDVEEDGEEELDEEEDSSDDKSLKSLAKNNKVVKKYKKKKRKFNKLKKLFKGKIIAFKEVLLFALIIAVVLLWGTIKSLLHWLAGQEEITIVDKSIDSGCYEIITDTDSYCVDKASYDLAVVGGNYLLEEYQYHYILREEN